MGRGSAKASWSLWGMGGSPVFDLPLTVMPGPCLPVLGELDRGPFKLPPCGAEHCNSSAPAPSEPRVNPRGLYFHFFLAGRNFLLLRKTSLNRAMNWFQGVPHIPQL